MKRDRNLSSDKCPVVARYLMLPRVIENPINEARYFHLADRSLFFLRRQARLLRYCSRIKY